MKRFLTIAVMAALSVSTALAADQKRPNILFAFADDWGRHTSAYAKLDGPGTCNDIISTPNFDRLAKEGVLFRSAFVSAPSCTPCRSALLSGQHFWRTGRGSILSGAIWDGTNPAYPLLLQNAGYHLGKSFKVWSPGNPGDAPYGEQKNAYEKAGKAVNQFSEYVTNAVSKGTPAEKAKQELYDQVRENFDNFLADRKPGQPFCFWYGPTNVHRKWIKGSGKALWGLNPDDLKGKMPKFLPDVPEVREDLADYFGEVQAFDACIGVMMKRLEEIGELDNTLIVASGDHGGPGFPHGKCNLYDFGVGVSLVARWGGAKGGRVVDDLITLPDLAPTFLELGGVTPPDVMTGRSLVGILKSDKSGQVDKNRDAVFVGRERHVGDSREGDLPYPMRAVRTHDYLYVVNFHPERWPMGDPRSLDSAAGPTTEQVTEDTRVTLSDCDAGPTKAWVVEHRNDPKFAKYYEIAFGKRPREELYVLADDRDEVKNVAADAKYASIKSQLDKRLMDELRTTGDPRVVDDGKFYETPPMAGPIPVPQGKKNKKGGD
jgi:arylsulfatase A-like enzyme